MNKLSLMALPAALALIVPMTMQAQVASDSVQRKYNVDRPDLQRYADATSSKDITKQSEVFRDVAKSGKLGRLPARYTRALNDGSKQIEKLLKGHDSIAELDANNRDQLDSARWDIINVMVKFDPTRVICSEVAVTGSRVLQTQCLSVYEAIERQKAAQQAAGNMINGMSCLPGADGHCSNGG